MDLTIEVVHHDDGRIVKSTVRIHNKSASVFCVPAAYVTVYLVSKGLSNHDKLDMDKYIKEGKYIEHSVQNTCRYPAMSSIAPDEDEQCITWHFFTKGFIAQYETVIIQADVVGGKQEGLFGGTKGEENRRKFVEWMGDNGSHERIVFRSETGQIYERYKKAKMKPPLRRCMPTKRCLLAKVVDARKNPVLDETGKPAYQLHMDATYYHRVFLQSSMMWDRYAIVSLS